MFTSSLLLWVIFCHENLISGFNFIYPLLLLPFVFLHLHFWFNLIQSSWRPLQLVSQQATLGIHLILHAAFPIWTRQIIFYILLIILLKTYHGWNQWQVVKIITASEENYTTDKEVLRLVKQQLQLSSGTKILVFCKIRMSCRHLLISKPICEFIHCLPAFQNLHVHVFSKMDNMEHHAVIEFFVKWVWF